MLTTRLFFSAFQKCSRSRLDRPKNGGSRRLRNTVSKFLSQARIRTRVGKILSQVRNTGVVHIVAEPEQLEGSSVSI